MHVDYGDGNAWQMAMGKATQPVWKRRHYLHSGETDDGLIPRPGPPATWRFSPKTRSRHLLAKFFGT